METSQDTVLHLAGRAQSPGAPAQKHLTWGWGQRERDCGGRGGRPCGSRVQGRAWPCPRLEASGGSARAGGPLPLRSPGRQGHTTSQPQVCPRGPPVPGPLPLTSLRRGLVCDSWRGPTPGGPTTPPSVGKDSREESAAGWGAGQRGRRGAAGPSPLAAAAPAPGSAAAPAAGWR